MALETLRGVKEIDGFKTMSNEERPLNTRGEVNWKEFDKMRELIPICIDHEKGMISFKIQSDPISKVGVNGCQFTALIDAARLMLIKLNQKFPCRENAITLTKLDEALMWQSARTADRIIRGVEGKNEA